ncbi:MAG: hypothetical protein JWR88_1355 [Pseudonocardia sp.]|jgi:hypothetical protein|nr:hypothetical protein [Pseudonocardia sp.]
MTNPNDPSGPPNSEPPDPTQPPADTAHSPASPPAWQQQPQDWQQTQQQPNPDWQQTQQQPGWGQPPPPPPGGWQQPPQQPQGAPPWDQPTESIGWSHQPQQGWEQQAPQPTQVWGQEQPPWGQQQSWQPPGYPGAGTGRRRSRGLLPWILVGTVVLILAVVGVLGFWKPGFFAKKVFDANAVQTGVTTVLTNDYKLTNVTGVTCPAQQEVKAGATFTCTADVGGRSRTVPITVKTSDGSYEVGRPA